MLAIAEEELGMNQYSTAKERPKPSERMAPVRPWPVSPDLRKELTCSAMYCLIWGWRRDPGLGMETQFSGIAEHAMAPASNNPRPPARSQDGK